MILETYFWNAPIKTISEVIKKDFEINDLDRSMVFDRTLWRKLNHLADST